MANSGFIIQQHWKHNLCEDSGPFSLLQKNLTFSDSKIPAKTPIKLKAANNKKGKRFKLKDILSHDMVSLAFGYFCQAIHIGKEGESMLESVLWAYRVLPGQQHVRLFTETPSCTQRCHLFPDYGGFQAFMLLLLSLVTFKSKQETFGPAKLPSLSCEPVIEEKAPEKSSLLENRTVHQGNVLLGLQWVYMAVHLRQGTATPPAFQNSTLAALLRTCLTIPPRASLSRVRLKSEESSDLMGSFFSLQLHLGPSFLDQVLNVLDKNKYQDVSNNSFGVKKLDMGNHRTSQLKEGSLR
ncbi:cdc42 effector protein 3-like [Glossophaga mutica]